MSERKLWKVISISKTKGSRISKSLTYGDALARYTAFRKDLADGDTLYMIQVLEVACGRASIPVGVEEIEITEAVGFAGAAA